MDTLARHLLRDRAHQRLVTDPATDNDPAFSCYTAVGLRRVGILPCCERDAQGTGRHDGQLMNMRAGEELDQPR